MTWNLTLTATALTVGVCLQPSLAAAQASGAPVAEPPASPPAAPPASPPPAAVLPATPVSDNDISIGAQWLGGRNTNLFGRYNGFTDRGFDLLSDFTFSRRDAPSSGKTFYFDVTGVNVDLQTGDRLTDRFSGSAYRSMTTNDIGPEAQLSFRLGDQGSWSVGGGYQAITYTGNLIDSIYSMNGTTGVLNDGAPAWGGATNLPPHKGGVTAFTVPTLLPLEQPTQVGTRRDIVEFGASRVLDGWTVSANIRHEHKEGSLEESLFQSGLGGYAFAMPVDYDTDRLDVSASFRSRNIQGLLQYTFANFSDNNSGVTLPYPNSVSALSATSGPYAQSSLYSQPPSNSAHYLTAQFGDTLTPGTRLTANARVGAELQNSAFPANNADPGLSPTLGAPTYAWFQHLNGANQGTSANSLDASAFVYQGGVSLSSDLAHNLNGRLSYNVDGRNVHVNQFEVWTGGEALESAANTPAYVVPQNWFKQSATVEASYRIPKMNNTRVVATYNYNDTDRTNAQVDHSITNTETLQINTMLGRSVMTRLDYSHQDRSGDLVYGRAWGNLESGTPELYDTPSGAYYQAPMTADSITWRGDVAASGPISGGVYFKYANEHYTYPSIPFTAPTGDWTLVGHGEGITHDDTLTVGPDLNFRPSDKLNLHVYYSYERIFYDNRGNGACAESDTGACAGSVGYFKNTYSSAMNTAGVNLEWQASAKLKVKLDYSMSSGSVIFGEFNGVEVTTPTQAYQNVSPYPNVNSQLYSLNVAIVYHISRRVDWGLVCEYNKFFDKDFDFVGTPLIPTVAGGSAISTLTPGNGIPNYNVSLIRTVFKVKL